MCSSTLEDGATYIVYSGGSSTGNAINGLYSGGTYKDGMQITSLTNSGMVTSFGSAGHMPPDGGFHGGGRR